MRRLSHIGAAALLLVMYGCGGRDARKDRVSPAAAGDTTSASGPADATLLIDRYFATHWQQAKVRPAPDASDAEFLRRVTLDLTGRIPTPAEVNQFLGDRSAGKRAALVDRLLQSEDYATYWAQVYTDMLLSRGVRLKARGRFAAVFTEWLRKSFQSSMPLDRMAHEMLAARGSMTENGAIGYMASFKLRDGSIETLAGNTSRVFLGLQIQCAQCHDHPTDKQWKKVDFAGFAAFFGELRMPRTNKKRPETSYSDDLNLGFEPRPQAKREYRRVAPRFLHRTVTPLQGESRRDALARVVTSSPLFARVTVGFTWDRLFGRGLTEPWDDLGSEDDARQPPVLRDLAAAFAAAKYDHRWLLRAIVLSKVYGRSSSGGAAAPDAPPDALEAAFARAAVRPLTADQLLASQVLATGVENSSARSIVRGKTDQLRMRVILDYLQTFDDDEGGDADAFTGSIPQALLLRNGEVNNAPSVPGSTLGEILAATGDPEQRVERMFVAAYARPPTEPERRTYAAYLRDQGNRQDAYEDLFHAMLTSTEFITNH